MAGDAMRLAAVTALVLAGVGGCAPTSSDEPSDQGERFDLYTHCGIHELVHEGKRYVRESGRLHDGSSNPPEGWGNPYQEGRLKVEGDTATFTDDEGHREEFVLRKGATKPLDTCD